MDYEEDAQQWFDKVLAILDEQPAAAPAPVVAPAAAKKPAGKKYHNGTILANINLNDRGSNKKTYHIEIGTDEPIEYEPGDTIGIIPRNREDVVNRIISLTGIDETLVVEATKAKATVKELLSQHLNICYLLTSTIKKNMRPLYSRKFQIQECILLTCCAFTR